MQKLTFNKMYEIIVNNDASYDGKFFYAVKTTKIFCNPSCKSRPPKVENVEFFNSAQESIKAGYRPCKRCRSDLYDYNHTMAVAQTIKKIIDNTFDDSDLLNSGLENIKLSSKRMVEIFKIHYDKTPSCYIMELRINKAKEFLEKTDKQILEVAFESGFNSISTFYRVFKLSEKISPNEYRNK